VSASARHLTGVDEGPAPRGILQPLKNRKRQDDTYFVRKCIPSPPLRGIARVGRVCAAACWCAAVPRSAEREHTGAQTPDSSLTWNGITLYGIVDVGVHTDPWLPISDYFPAGPSRSSRKQQRSDHRVTPATDQSRVAFGNEPLMGLSGCSLETFFNPQSGNLSDALKSSLNNGRRSPRRLPMSQQLAVSCCGAAYAGFSSRRWHLYLRTPCHLLADGVGKYDPMGQPAFSLIGFSGTPPRGDTEIGAWTSR